MQKYQLPDAQSEIGGGCVKGVWRDRRTLNTALAPSLRINP